MSTNTSITKINGTQANGTQANGNNPSSRKTSFRLSDLSKILEGRYGGPCRTGDAERYFVAAIPMLMPKARSWRLAVKWAKDWTPVLLEHRGEEWVRDQWLEVAKRKRPNLTSDQLARLLQVADDEPKRFGLRCIPATSRTKKIRETDDRERRTKAERDRRAQEPGYRSHEERRKDREEITELLGIGDRQARRLRAEGRLDSMLAEAREARKAAQTPECPLFVPLVSGSGHVRFSCPSDPLPVLTGSGLPGGTNGERSAGHLWGQEAPDTDVPALAMVGDAPVFEEGFAGRPLTLDAIQMAA